MSGRTLVLAALVSVCSALSVWALRARFARGPDPTDGPRVAEPLAAPVRESSSAAPRLAVERGTQAAAPAKPPAPSRAKVPARLRVPQRPPRTADARREFIARLFRPPGPDATPSERESWEQAPQSDYLYPPDHPCAGQPLDSVTPAILAKAGNATLDPLIDSLPDVDRPQCHLDGNWPYRPLNQCTRGLQREDPESVEAFMACLAALPQDPAVYPADIWVPCPGDHPLATTLRAHLESLVAAEVERVFSRATCPQP
jgi:hypothetical protein